MSTNYAALSDLAMEEEVTFWILDMVVITNPAIQMPKDARRD